MKDRSAILGHRWLRPFAHLFAHPSLWHSNRRSIPRGLAIGLFIGFLIPLGQFVAAALLAIPLRANVFISAAATLVTNPLTFPFIYLAAFATGQGLMDRGLSSGEASESYLAAALDVSAATALGLLLFATLASLCGYVIGALWWRLRLVRRWRRRRSDRRTHS